MYAEKISAAWRRYICGLGSRERLHTVYNMNVIERRWDIKIKTAKYHYIPYKHVSTLYTLIYVVLSDLSSKRKLFDSHLIVYFRDVL